MTDCLDERITKHFRGRWYGFGPVKDAESVVFAVFGSTKLKDGRLIADSFDNKHLKTNAQSLARQSFVTKAIFDSAIVRGAGLSGVAVARVAAIRALTADVKINAGQISVRACCVLDRVDEGDCEGHATAGYSERQAILGMREGQLGKVRAKVRMDLANTFSEVRDPISERWARSWELFVGRVKSIVRSMSFDFLTVAR
jgi:hypothetical protein